MHICTAPEWKMCVGNTRLEDVQAHMAREARRVASGMCVGVSSPTHPTSVDSARGAGARVKNVLKQASLCSAEKEGIQSTATTAAEKGGVGPRMG